MPLTTCNQREFLIESRLNGFFFFFSVTFGLRNFYRGEGREIFIGERGDEVR